MKKYNDLAAEFTGGAVCVVRPGEERPTEQGFYAPATVTLIRDEFSVPIKGYTLIDAGAPGDEQTIRRALASRKATPYGILFRVDPKEIKDLIITHNHPDHTGGCGFFKKARVIGPDSMYKVDDRNNYVLMPPEVYQTPGTEIKIPNLVTRGISLISTPGHSGWDLSVLRNGKRGLVAVVGDLVWSERDWNEDSEWRTFCVNPEMQERSREVIRQLKPDVVVPGHGPAFAPKY